MNLTTKHFPALHTAIVIAILLLAGPARGAEPPQSVKTYQHQITGLFSIEREKDLQEIFAKLPEFKLVKIDFENAEVSLEYDLAKVFPGAKPEQVIERLDDRVKNASEYTFGVKPLRSLPKDKLTLIEIPVAGLDCKACCFGAYCAIYQVPGVEVATDG